MKTVLFATTALVAFAGAASAASHDSGATVSFSGEMTAGYNDNVDNGIFWDADLDLTAAVDFGDSVTATLTTQVAKGNELGGSVVFTPTVEVVYTASSLTASLKVGDLGDKGASEYFYADRSGMAVDVENHDATADARALIEFGSFGVAIGCEVVENGLLPVNYTGTCNEGAYNIGAGATFGSIKLGVGYDNNVGGLQRGVTSVSADATFGSLELGVSYASASAAIAPHAVAAAQNSIGVEVGATFGAIELGAYFASNSVADDEYGVSVDYTAGALTLGVRYDNVDNGGAGSGRAEYGVDLAYAVSDSLTASAGYFNGAADTYAAGVKTAGVVGGYYYAGIEYAVNDNISATLSYATANEISGPEFKDGISAFITAEF